MKTIYRNILADIKIVTVILITISAIGCGGAAAPGTPLEVKGTVTLDGQPLGDATVGFVAITEGIPVTYRYASAVTEADGTFKMEKVYPAEYMVTLNHGPEADENAAVVTAVAGNDKLAKYANNSPLRAEVSGDKTDFKFDATSTN